jgi:hypothetical protein
VAPEQLELDMPVPDDAILPEDMLSTFLAWDVFFALTGAPVL